MLAPKRPAVEWLRQIKTMDLIKSFLLAILIIPVFAVAVQTNFKGANNQQFSDLAYSFLHGQVNFMETSIIPRDLTTMKDTVFLNNSHYWPLGPFPAIILMPFVFIFALFQAPFWQGYLAIFLTVAVLVLSFKIARAIKFSRFDAAFLAVAFCFASAFIEIIVISDSWKFAHAVTVFLLLWAILEYLGKKRWWLIGTILGGAFLTRATAGIGIIFFVLSLLFSSQPLKIKFKSLGGLLFPFILICSFILPYNYARFGNVWEQGYSLASLGNPQDQHEFFTTARAEGVFSLSHLPGNLYYAFLAVPQPVFREAGSHLLRFPYIYYDGWGLSIFVTSPYLLYLLFKRIRGQTALFLRTTIIAIAIPIFVYFGIGFWQFGYRYALDFFPFLFLLFGLTVKYREGRLPRALKIIILGSAAFNWYLLLPVIGMYLSLN